MSIARSRLLGLSVAAAALLAGVAAATPDVKGPVHITSRGVEIVSLAEWEAGDDGDNDYNDIDDAVAEARQSAYEAIEEGRQAAREAAREARYALAEAQAEARAALDEARAEAQDAAEQARAEAQDAAEQARAEARAAADCAREAAREARDAARREARKAREIARIAHDNARTVVENAMIQVHVATGNVQIEIGAALGDVTEARLDIMHAATQLAAAEAGDFSGIVIVSKGVMKCGDAAAHEGCVALTAEDKARVTRQMSAALQAAAKAMEAAQAGLGAASRAAAED